MSRGAPARPPRTQSGAAGSERPARAPDVRLAHLSDIHFGRIAHPAIVRSIVADVNAAEPDLVVASGDLTQRARRHEFRAARAMLDAFDAPVLVVPGNHDVRAWWHNPVERIWRSSKRFRRYISTDVTPTFSSSGLAVFGLNSAHGATIKGGKIRPRHVAEMEAFFKGQPTDVFRVLVLHHHLLRLEALGAHDVSRGAALALDAARRAHVDLVLCGHLHRSHVEPVELAPPSLADPAGHHLVIASAGTATSNRGRAENANVNFYNWIDVEAETFTVRERRFDAGAGAFVPEQSVAFSRDDR